MVVMIMAALVAVIGAERAVKYVRCVLTGTHEDGTTWKTLLRRSAEAMPLSLALTLLSSFYLRSSTENAARYAGLLAAAIAALWLGVAVCALIAAARSGDGSAYRSLRGIFIVCAAGVVLGAALAITLL